MQNELTKEIKHELWDILNQTVSVDSTRQTVLNAARIYSHSVFEALNDEDVSKIKFMQLL